MPRAFSSGAASIWSYGLYSPKNFVIAAVSDVLPWSTCPIVPTFTCGFVRSNFPLAISLSLDAYSWVSVRALGVTSRKRQARHGPARANPTCPAFAEDRLHLDILRHGGKGGSRAHTETLQHDLSPGAAAFDQRVRALQVCRVDRAEIFGQRAAQRTRI